VDDLNMPRLDAYGTQQPIALLRQVVERRGMYDRGKELSWKNLKDVQVGDGRALRWQLGLQARLGFRLIFERAAGFASGARGSRGLAARGCWPRAPAGVRA
jgi:hypothetical protein